MRCDYFDAGLCGSCTLIELPMPTRIAAAQARTEELLAPFAAEPAAQQTSIWHSPITGPEAGFRNKAKMVVSGSTTAPKLGILDESGHGVDLRACPLYPPAIHELLAHLPALIARAQIPPYDVGRRKGELKHIIITAGDDGGLMLRFVLASPKPIPRITEHLPTLQKAVPGIEVVSANINPAHTAVLEGTEEIHIAGQQTLRVTQGRIPLRVRPQSFLQTNTSVAGELYEQVATWIDEIAIDHAAHSHRPLRIWDLFCGVGGFALHCALPVAAGDNGGSTADPTAAVREVTGVEVSAQAIESALQTAAELGLDAEFTAADAFSWARAEADRNGPPDVLIVNPPRRGIGAEMAAWIEATGISEVIYSSCNPTTLARDLAAMPSMRIVSARMLDMFPHTAHAEVLTRLRRTSAAEPQTEA